MSRWSRVVPVVLLLTTGCLGEHSGFEFDPLTGGAPIPSRPTAPRGGGTPPGAGKVSGPASGEVPALPPTHTPTSSAALAGSSRSETQESGVAGARLGGPTPSAGEGRIVPRAGTGSLPTGALNAPVSSYEQLQVMLAARGVTMQHLQTVGDRGEWKFSCAVPNRKEPGLRRVYEATASGSHGLAAIETVLQKIDEVQGPPGS